jgi:1,4-dihydroxy-6-naphthoate synthase
MYVNDYTVDYGDRGREAVTMLLERAFTAGLIARPVHVTFVDDGETSLRTPAGPRSA